MTDHLIVEISQTGFTNGLTISYNSNVAAARHYRAVTATTGTAGAGLLNFGYDLVTTSCSGTQPPANAVTVFRDLNHHLLPVYRYQRKG